MASMDSILGDALVLEDVARDYGVMVIKSAGLEMQLSKVLVKEMREALKVIDPRHLKYAGAVAMEFAWKISLERSQLGVIKMCPAANREGQKILIREVAVYLKLKHMQGNHIPRLLAYGVTEGPGAADFFSLTEYIGEIWEPSVNDLPELIEILNEMHQHGIILGECEMIKVLRSQGKLMLVDLSTAVFEKRKSCHRQEIDYISEKCRRGA